jgi:hypothetical protein
VIRLALSGVLSLGLALQSDQISSAQLKEEPLLVDREQRARKPAKVTRTGTMQVRETESKRRLRSGSDLVKLFCQKLYRGFLMISRKVMRSPHGCGRFTISRSSSTLYKIGHVAQTTHQENQTTTTTKKK